MKKLILFIILIFEVVLLNNKVYGELDNTFNTKIITELKDSTLQNKIKNNLINQHYMKLEKHINDYIDSVAPKSKLKSKYIIDLCEKYNVDLCFVIAQGQLESHFGTSGIARKTNSVWNVNSCDGYSASKIIKNGNGYISPNHSIEPYLILLTNKYLVNKSEHDLMKKFTNIYGKRYATCSNYEYKLKNIYNYIRYNTRIYELYYEYLNLKNYGSN